jgi:DNA-binding NarL/FixJ family response regulator
MAGSSFPTQIVGRGRELELVSRAVNHVSSGSGSALAFTGEPGIGKTVLATEAANRTVAAGGSVAWGRSFESTGSIPFDPWQQVLLRLIRELDIATDSFPRVKRLLNPSDDSAYFDSEIEQRLLFIEVEEVLRLASSKTPVCLVLDDLQWADSNGIQLFEFIAKGVYAYGILIVVTFRENTLPASDALPRAIGNLSNEQAFELVALDRLSNDESVELFARYTSVQSLESSGEIQLAAGNPMFLIAVARAADGNASTFSEIVLNQLSTLEPNAIDVLKVSALLGSTWNLDMASVLFDDPEAALKSWDQAETIGLLEQSSSTHELQFWHPLVREAIIDNLTAVEKAKLHASIATRFSNIPRSNPVEAHQLAHHYIEAAPVLGDQSAIRHALVAANQAFSVTGYQAAGDLYFQALDLLKRSGDERLEADAAAGYVRSRLSTLTGPSRAELGPYLVSAFNYYLENGHVDLAVNLACLPFWGGVSMRIEYGEIVPRAMDLISPPSIEYGRLISNLGTIHYYSTGEFDVSMRYLQEALEISNTNADANLKTRVLRNIGNIRHYHNFKDGTELELAEQTIAAAKQTGNLLVETEAARAAAIESLGLGDALSAERYASESLSAAETARNTNEILYSLHVVSIVAQVQGNWDKWLEASERALSYDRNNTAVVQGFLPTLELLGEYERVDEELERFVPITPGLKGQFDRSNIATALMETTHRSPENARVALDLLNIDYPNSPLPRRAIVQGQLMKGAAHAELGNRDEVEATIDWFNENPDADSNEVFVDVWLSKSLSFTGRYEEAFSRLDKHLVQFDQTITLRAVLCHLKAKYLLERAQKEDVAAATDLLSEAITISENFSMKGLTDQVVRTQEVLRNLSARNVRVDGLTRRELEVLKLVALGKSNPEIAEELFISRHTVVSHISHILEKIGAENRAQAATYAITHGIE